METHNVSKYREVHAIYPAITVNFHGKASLWKNHCPMQASLCRSLLIIQMNESRGYLKNLFRTLLEIFIHTLLGWVAQGLLQNATKIKLDLSRNLSDFHIW